MRPVDLYHGAATDVGLVRSVNEDAYLVAPPVFVVADGMGGHAGGDVASQIVVEEFTRLAEEGYDPTRGADHVAQVLSRAQSRLLAYGDSQRVTQPQWHAGTTVVAALLVEQDGVPGWLVTNLGDSRAYAHEGGVLRQVTVDHSVVQELIDAGRLSAAEASTHPERHVITRALGSRSGIVPEFFWAPLASTSRLLLCSDGVSGLIGDDEIARILTGVEDSEEAAQALVVAALAAGGRDNATAVVVDVVGWEFR
ncbi:MAG: PP2C family protein-serine/threonine phosphatase [Nocardioides sp.]|uniref:PP2C family protein-serine/threonine phosphatase n=1 Tax=Nocardioides sp. TaxID=35761 RepID=UPI003F0981FB